MTKDDAAAAYPIEEARGAQVMDAPPGETTALSSTRVPNTLENADAVSEYDALTISDDDVKPESESGAATGAASESLGGSDPRQVARTMWARVAAYFRSASNVRYSVLLSVSIVALLVSLLDFGLITGALRIPTPGLQVGGATSLADRATYGFEYDTEGWQARGAVTSAVWNNVHAFAGQGALEVQVAGLTQKNNGFVYITAPAKAKPGSTVVAHVYAPTGAPPMVVTLYALDGIWAWSSGPYPSVNPGSWIAVSYTIPATLQGPIREMGVMLVGPASGPPFSGVIFVDAVNIQN